MACLTLRVALLFAVFIISVTKCVSKVCGQTNLGITDCIEISHYSNVAQWGTCITDEYMQQRSKGKHYCRDRTATYCWYQCMLEQHNLSEGPVYQDCKCESGVTFPPRPTLPDHCYSPDGTDCTWYRQCLEERYPCSGSESSYAIKFAEKFCNLYLESYSGFSDKGQRWINAVRKCLQVALVPTLRPWEDKTCEEIKDIAFESHTPCYVSPYEDAPSICELSCLDWGRVFWTVKSAFIDEFSNTMVGMIHVLYDCIRDGRGVPCPLQVAGEAAIGVLLGSPWRLNLGLTVFRFFTRDRRSTTNDNLNEFAYRVGNAVAADQKWHEKGLDWFAYVANSSDVDNNNNTVRVSMLLASRAEVDLSYNGTHTDVNLTATALALARSVQKGTLSFKLGSETVKVQEMEACHDFSCNTTFIEAIAQKTDISGAPVFIGNQMNTMIWAYLIYMLTLQ